ncbi:MAG TPA: hypothetical protein VGB54_09125 [Allosphingosinicella sp.]
MTLLTYSRSRLQIGIALFSLAVVGAVLRILLMSAVAPVMSGNAFFEFRLGLVLPMGLAITAAILWRMFNLLNGDLVALKTLPEGLQVTSFFRRRTIPWDSLLGGHKVTYWIGLSRRRRFNIRYLDDGTNRTMRIPLILAQRPEGGHESLSGKVENAREKALGRPLSPGGKRLPGTGIDHDAAIARYLEAKAQAAVAAAAIPEPSAEPALAARPVRPAFGRKGLG